MFEVTLIELSLYTDDPAALVPRLLPQHLPGEVACVDALAIAGNLATVGILCHACSKAMRMAFRCASATLRHLSARRTRRPAEAGPGRGGTLPTAWAAAPKATIVTREQPYVAPLFFSWQTGQVPLRANR